MEIEKIKEIISPVVCIALEMEEAKKDWIEKIHKWREKFTENGKTTILFEEIPDEDIKGYFYRDLSLANENISHVYHNGTPVIIQKIICYAHTSSNYTKNGEFYPNTVFCILFEFYSTSDNSYIKEHFPGHLIWRSGLFDTYLNWPKEYGKGIGIGFASKYFSGPQRFSKAGWTMIFDDDNFRNLIIQKFKEIELCLVSLLPENYPKKSLLYK